MNTKLMLLAVSVLVGTGLSALAEQPACPMVKPGFEHAWLQQGVGDWVSTTEMVMGPGQPPMVTKGTETIRPIGALWTVTQVNGRMMDTPFLGNMTLGYDTDKKQYVGTWVDSMTGKLWLYHGNLDDAKKTLTLESEGVCPMHPGKVSQFKDVIEMTDKNHKKFTSAIKGEDGKWVTLVTSVAERVITEKK